MGRGGVIKLEISRVQKKAVSVIRRSKKVCL